MPMKTVRIYSRSSEAEMAQQRLAAEGIEAMLVGEATEEIGCAVTDGIRLEVDDAEATRAEEILHRQENDEPLPDDFVPPAEVAAEEAEEPAPEPNALWMPATYFIGGGLLALVAGGLLAVIYLLAGKPVTVTLVNIIILFSIGAVLGLAAAGAKRLSEDDEKKD